MSRLILPGPKKEFGVGNQANMATKRMDSKRRDPPRMFLFSSQGYEEGQTKSLEKRIQSEAAEDYLVW